VIWAVTGAFERLIALKVAILPLPVAAKPIEVWSLVQVKLVLFTAPLNVIGELDEPLQIAWLAG
jgi:hypothetical protein